MINSIKAWLQMFGERDNETFSIQLEKWKLSLQYNFDLDDGFEITPTSRCVHGYKHIHDTELESRTDLELEEILSQLRLIQTYW